MSHLLWELTRKNNAFLVKRNGIEFSTDPFNLTGRNLYSHSGLVNNHSIGISTLKHDKAGVRYSLNFQKNRNWGKVAKKGSKDLKKTGNAAQVWNFHNEHLPVNSLQRASKVINKKFEFHRRDLRRLALRKLLAAHRAGLGKRKPHVSRHARQQVKKA